MTSKPTHLTRATLAAALLSATVLMQPAHAGLIGGGGAVGGGFSGALGGGLSSPLGQRSLDMRGSAAGQLQHDVALRRAQATQAQATQAAQTGQAQATQAAQTGQSQATQAATAARGQAEAAATRSASVEAQKSLSLQPRTNGVDASGAAAAQATRGSRSVGAGGAAQASVQR
jgi:hypothetical protein